MVYAQNLLTASFHVYIYPHHRGSFARDTHLLSFQHSSSATWHCVEILIRQDLICPIRPTINENSHDRPCTHPQAATHKTRDNGVVQDPCLAPSPIIHSPPHHTRRSQRTPTLVPASAQHHGQPRTGLCAGRSTTGRSRRHGTPPYLQLNVPQIHLHTRAARGV